MRFQLETRYADYDTKGHVNNAVFLTYFDIARSKAWLEVVGGTADFPFVVAEATVRYVREAMIGEALDVEITTSEIRTKAWVWRYRVLKRADERLVADGSTVQVMFDYQVRRSMPIPEELKDKLASL
jgi:acyl-CoA thioester hydrolase